MKKFILEILKRTATAALAASLALTALPVHAAQVTDELYGDDVDIEEDDETTEEAPSAFIQTPWTEQGVSGSDTPTLSAPSPEEYSESYNAGNEVEDNLYDITISTGMKEGTKGVRYISVQYTDVDGSDQTKYILMSDNPLQHSIDYALEHGSANDELKKRHEELSLLNYKINEPENLKPMESWSADDYLFTTEKEIATVNDIHIFMRGGESWTVQGMVLSKVTKVAGVGEYGFYSGKYFLGLSKKPICRLKTKNSGSLTLSPPKGADQRYKLAGGKNAYFEMEQLQDAEETASSFNDLFTIRLDFADTPEGGIESYMSSDVGDGKSIPKNLSEQLALQIEYRDNAGGTKNVTLPVMLSAYGQYAASEDTVHTIGLGQRGETVAFTGYLPGFASIISSKLFVGVDARKKLNDEGGITAINSSMEKELNSDNISLAGISIYKGTCRLSNTEDGTDLTTGETLKSYTTAYSFSESAPIFYYTNTDPRGKVLIPGSTTAIKFKDYKTGSPLVASKPAENVLVRLKTNGDNTVSGTTADVKMQVTYYDEDGKKQRSSQISVMAQTEDYLGYWPTTTDKKENFAYDLGMNPGNYEEFWLELPRIVSVADIDVELSNTDDEYVLGGFSVMVAEDFGRRRIYAQENTGSRYSSKLRIVRDSTNAALDGFPVTFSEPRVFSGGDVYNYTIGGDTGGGIRFVDTDDYTDMRYSMTHDQTKQNLGFGKARMTYEVGVKVADDADSMNENGDSGSVNKFYFQLQFQNGNSAFVQANQQMYSDGFRSGYTETFNIAVNHNYGNLKSVRIIPEDTQSENEIFDKLNIEYITVTESNGGGTATQYVIDNVGWIGIDYHDEAEGASIRGRAGRMLSEISSRYTVSYQRKVVSLLCEITSLPTQIQPEASIACELTYVDTNNITQTTNFDVVRRMADYMKKPTRSYEAPTNGTDARYYQDMASVSDPKWMLRASHTDRFILPALVNLKSVKSMKLVAVNRGEGTAYWNIGSVTLSAVIEDGPLTITSDDEYLRSMNTSPLCQRVSTKDYDSFPLTAGTAQSLDITFSENELVYSDGETWATPVTRLPEGAGDTLNVYVYPTERARNISGVNIAMAAQYSTAFSGNMQTSDNSLRIFGSGTENAMFYSTGLNVDGMERLVSLGIRCVSNTQTFDYAIAQHIRDNVVVATYYIPLLGGVAKVGLTGKPETMLEGDKHADNRVQRMFVSFDEDTEESALFEVDKDVAVSFKYRSNLDNGEGEYYTPYVYMTDMGYSSIRGGLMAEFDFDIPYIREITGYRIGAFGDISANVAGAQIVTYTYDKKSTDDVTGGVLYENMTRETVYSIDDSYEISNAIEDFDISAPGFNGDDTINLVDLTFKTQDALSTHESGTSDPVEMVFYYLNHMGALNYKYIKDIRAYIQSDNRSFNTSSLSAIQLFLPECSEMVAILIVPYNETGTATWSIEEVSGFMSYGDKPLNRAVNKQFTNQTKEIISFLDGYELPDVSVYGMGHIISNNPLKVTTFDYGPIKGDRTAGTVTDHNASIELKSGETVRFYPGFEGGGGYTAKAAILRTSASGNANDTTTGFVEIDCLIDTNGVVTFVPRRSDEALSYKVIITSSYDPSLSDTIDITVAGTNTTVTGDQGESEDAGTEGAEQPAAEQPSTEQPAAENETQGE